MNNYIKIFYIIVYIVTKKIIKTKTNKKNYNKNKGNVHTYKSDISTKSINK